LLWPLFSATLGLYFFLNYSGWFSTLGGLSLIGSLLWLIDRLLDFLIPRWHRRVDRLIVCILAFGIAITGHYGLRLEQEKLYGRHRIVADGKWEDAAQEHAEAIYEVAQLFLLNTAVEKEEENQSDSASKGAGPGLLKGRSAEYHSDQAMTGSLKHPGRKQSSNLVLSIARILSVVFAIFVAYQVIALFFRGTVDRIYLFFYGLLGPRPALVIGLGFIGIQLVKELRSKRVRVIAIEANSSNPNISTARERGAIVVDGNANDPELLRDIDIDGIGDIFVVAGKDDTNIRIAMLLADDGLSDSKYGLLRWILNMIKKECESNCYVRLYDPDLYVVLDRAFEARNQSSKSITNVVGEATVELACSRDVKDLKDRAKQSVRFVWHQLKRIASNCLGAVSRRLRLNRSYPKSNLILRPFNSDQNSVRLMIQHQLSDQKIRPSQKNQVGTWLIAGFGDMGQEVALGLARLAHFENGKRSRMLILDDGKDQTRIERFLNKYPRFTVPKPIRKDFQKVYFNPRLDDWSGCLAIDPSSERGIEFATQSYFSRLPSAPNDARFLAWVCDLMRPREGLSNVKPGLFVCFEDEGTAFVWANQFRRAYSEHCYREGLWEEYKNDPDFPCLPIFIWLPYQRALRNLTEGHDEVNDRFTSLHVFGDIEDAGSLKAIKERLRPKLAEIIQESYNKATKLLKESAPSTVQGTSIDESKKPVPQVNQSVLSEYPEYLRNNAEYSDRISNHFAADHAIIKYIIATNNTSHFANEPTQLTFPTQSSHIPAFLHLDQTPSLARPDVIQSAIINFRAEVIEILKKDFPDSGLEHLKSLLNHDASKTQEAQGSTLMEQLAMMEHYRWCSEMLLRDYSWIEKERKQSYKLKNGEKKDLRIPEHVFRRQTLLDWNDKGLFGKEKIKDTLQVYYILWYLYETSRMSVLK
jgi:hypothetical protein